MQQMQQVEDFMRELFHVRIEEEKRIVADRVEYRQKYFATDCRWDSRVGTLVMIESETITTVEKMDSGASVITAYRVPFFNKRSETYHRRYHLIVESNRWLIHRVETECLSCRGQGDVSCILCKGKHWLGGERGEQL